MSITATLIIQAIVFGILVWFTMKFVWPPIAHALDERSTRVAEGLAAADKAKAELKSAAPSDAAACAAETAALAIS